jgi:hypothetical protein
MDLQETDECMTYFLLIIKLDLEGMQQRIKSMSAATGQ